MENLSPQQKGALTRKQNQEKKSTENKPIENKPTENDLRYERRERLNAQYDRLVSSFYYHVIALAMLILSAFMKIGFITSSILTSPFEIYVTMMIVAFLLIVYVIMLSHIPKKFTALHVAAFIGIFQLISLQLGWMLNIMTFLIAFSLIWEYFVYFKTRSYIKNCYNFK